MISLDYNFYMQRSYFEENFNIQLIYLLKQLNDDFMVLILDVLNFS